MPRNGVQERGQRRGGTGLSELLGELGALEALENALGESRGQNGENGQNAKGAAGTGSKGTGAAVGGKNDTCPAGKTSTITITEQAVGVGGTGYDKPDSEV
jgi:hypothetical protein